MAYPAGLGRFHLISSRNDLRQHRKFKCDKKKRDAMRKQQEAVAAPDSDQNASSSPQCHPPTSSSAAATHRPALRRASSSTSSSSIRTVRFASNTKTTEGRVGNNLPRRRSSIITSIAEDQVDAITTQVSPSPNSHIIKKLRVANGAHISRTASGTHNNSNWCHYFSKILNMVNFSSYRARLDDKAARKKEKKKQKKQRKLQTQRNESLNVLAQSGWNISECSVRATYG